MPNERLAHFFFPLSPADTISTFCVVTSDYFSLIFLPFLSPLLHPGLPFLMAVHARCNRQIRMLARSPMMMPGLVISAGRVVARVQVCMQVVHGIRKSRRLASLSDAHASHRRDATRRADVYSTAAASAKPAESDFGPASCYFH